MGIYLLNQPIALPPVLLKYYHVKPYIMLLMDAIESANVDRCDLLAETSHLIMSESNKLTGHEIIVVDEALNGMVDMNKTQVAKDEGTSLVNVEILGCSPPNNFQYVLEAMENCDDFYRELLEDKDFQEITNMSKEEVNLLIRAEGENPDAIVAHIRDFACQIDNANVADLTGFKRKQCIKRIKDNATLNEAVSEIIASLEEKQDQYVEALKVLSVEEKIKPIKPPRVIRYNTFRDRKAWYQSYTKEMLKNSSSDELLLLLDSLRLKKPNLLPLAVSFLKNELENEKRIGAVSSNEKLINLVKKKLSNITKYPIIAI